MIKLNNICKSYGSVKVYENFNLDIEEGKITCILGSSGSGKTTLLNIVARLTEFEGDAPKLKCSYIFQTPNLVPSLTVFKNLSLVCGDEKKINEMIALVGLKGKEKRYPISLSGGEAQRVAIARAFLYDGDILLMDEPFSSLDLKLKQQIFDLFFDIWRKFKRTVVMVTHNPDEAAVAAERILILDGGKIKADYLPQKPVPRSLSKCGKIRDKVYDLLLK